MAFMRVLSCVWVAASLGACATTRARNETVCAEYRNLRCLTTPLCSMNTARGCRECQCSGATARPYQDLPNALPPDQRPQ